MKPFLIAACPRSGTTYTAEVFQRIGLDVGHEELKSDGCVSWAHGRHEGIWRCILHQVRHPIKVISSLRTVKWYDQERWVPFDELPKESVTRRATFWLWMNLWIEGLNPVYRYRVEDMTSEWDTICRFLDIEPCSLPDVSVTTNTRVNPEPVTWKDIKDRDTSLFDGIVSMGIRYGYTEEELLNLREGSRGGI